MNTAWSRFRSVWNWGFAPVLRTAANAVAGGLLLAPTGRSGIAIAATITGVLGAVHGWLMAYGKTYNWDKWFGWVEFIVDNTWALPNSVVGSVFATLNVWNSVSKETSDGSGTLFHKHGWFANYDTTLGNVTVGTTVPGHEVVHAMQARGFGPAFYPLFLASYVINTVLPYWLIYHDQKKCKINSIKRYFVAGVYPHTWFEEWAYSVQGSPPCPA